MRSRNLLVFGSDPQPARPVRLQAGALSLLFDPETAWVRRVCLGERELVRAVYAAVRDRNWVTAKPRIEELETEIAADSFRLRIGVACREREIDFFWRGEIAGTASSEIVFAFDGEARSTFFRNRLGLCALHPLSTCVGEPCEIEHVDGVSEAGSFPTEISPHQPFREIRAIRYAAGPDAEVEVRLEGETFEMEDQRNWTDASFKTYCTPLAAPFPVEVKAGTRIQQQVRIRLRKPRPLEVQAARERRSPVPEGRPIAVALPKGPRRRLSPIGLGMASHAQPLSALERARLRSLGLSHLRVDLAPGQADWKERLRRAADEVREIAASLHVALHVPPGGKPWVESVCDAWRRVDAPVSLWIAYSAGVPATTAECLAEARQLLGGLTPDVPVASGTDGDFVGLNRNRPEVPGLVSFSLNPQVHAVDSLSIVENLEAQAHAVRAAAGFAGGPVVVSPVTLRRRSNPDATAPEARRTPGELPARVDPRQMSLLGAAWTLGSLAGLSVLDELHSVTYFETTGWLGVMESEAGSPLLSRFPSAPGEVFPMFHVFADLAGQAAVADLALDDPRLTGLCLFGGEVARRLILGNLTGEGQTAAVQTQEPSLLIRLLDEMTVEEAMADPETYRRGATRRIAAEAGAVRIDLHPYAVASIDAVE
jgi:D-apionolactonase